MNDPGRALLVAFAAACLAAAPGGAGAQKKARAGEDAPHWADSPPRGNAAAERKMVEGRIGRDFAPKRR